MATPPARKTLLPVLAHRRNLEIVGRLGRAEQHLVGLLVHLLGEFLDGAEFHRTGVAVVHASGQLALADALGAHVALVGERRHVLEHPVVLLLVDSPGADFHNLHAELPVGKIALHLARDLARMAVGAVLVIDQDSV